jgi:predicted HAD superfamily phosphohydrolase YqeG
MERAQIVKEKNIGFIDIKLEELRQSKVRNELLDIQDILIKYKPSAQININHEYYVQVRAEDIARMIYKVGKVLEV